MSRETFAESVIPATGAADVPYADHRAIARGLMGRVGEMFIGQGTGAGGVGFDIENIPFEPAGLIAINQAGAAPAFYLSLYSATAAHVGAIDTGAGTTDIAANATPATVTKVADNDWTLGLTTGMAPDTEVVTVLIFGVRDVAPGL